jgi:hypothetical protein
LGKWEWEWELIRNTNSSFEDLPLASFYRRKKQGLKRHRRNAEVKRSVTAGVSNASKAVVFEDRKCSLDFFIQSCLIFNGVHEVASLSWYFLHQGKNVQ